MKYKLIATDIDDTLLNRQKQLTPATKAALMRAQENGVKIAVASGRLPYGVRPFAEALDVFRFGGYYMGFNGGAVMNSRGELIGSCHLDSKYIAPVYDIIRPFDVTTMVHKGDVIYADNEVMPTGTNKGVGLRTICEDAGIDISEAIAVGDSYNDIFMLKEAGLGIAMGNAEDAVKDVADMVTDDCDHDGIAKALQKLGII